MSKPSSRLGRGLASLMGPSVKPVPIVDSDHNIPVAGERDAVPVKSISTARVSDAEPQDVVQHISIDRIKPNPMQPRQNFAESELQELAASIRAKGVLQPILVRPLNEGRFELVAGERRWRAAAAAGLLRIPALVLQIDTQQSSEIALIENLQREDLTPLERAKAYQSYLQLFGLRPEELAQRLGESRANVVNYVRLLKLPTAVQEAMKSGALGMGHARAIVGITDSAKQIRIANLAIRRNLSVRQVEALAQQMGDESGANAISNGHGHRGGEIHQKELERALSKAVGLGVRVQTGRKKNAGRVVITYRNLEEFDALIARLGVRVDS
jgi:ParB family chromosome partitioning protein